MPPKADPYSTPAQKSIDAFLLLFTIVVIALVFYTGRHTRNASDGSQVLRASPPAQQFVTK